VFLLFLTLSFHTVFDGLAVGLQTRITAVWAVLGAVSIHKAVVSVCLGRCHEDDAGGRGGGGREEG
jgi:zinc transporter 1/2/3